MFALYCTVEEARVLRFARHVEGLLHPAPGAVDLVVRCACGELALVRTGRARGGVEDVVHGIPAAMLVDAA